MRPDLTQFARRPRMRMRPRTEGERVEDPQARPVPGAGGDGPQTTATLVDGPLAGESVEIAVVQGRPPMTVEVPTRDGSACRYCLDALVQGGTSATYTFVFRV